MTMFVTYYTVRNWLMLKLKAKLNVSNLISPATIHLPGMKNTLELVFIKCSSCLHTLQDSFVFAASSYISHLTSSTKLTIFFFSLTIHQPK